MRRRETQEVGHQLPKVSSIYELVLHNDEFNTFDFVIKSLIKYCNHFPEQAEQCATIAHHNGLCSILRGDRSEMRFILEKLSNAGLIVELQPESNF